MRFNANTDQHALGVPANLVQSWALPQPEPLLQQPRLGPRLAESIRLIPGLCHLHVSASESVAYLPVVSRPGLVRWILLGTGLFKSTPLCVERKPWPHSVPAALFVTASQSSGSCSYQEQQRILGLFELSQEFKQQHYLTGLLLTELSAALDMESEG